MVNARRAARELALKVLFQMDVGKHSVSDVMDGALEQIRHTVDHPVSQLLHELQAELRERVEERRPDLSSQSLRQVRNVAKTLFTELKELVEQTSARAGRLLANPSESAMAGTTDAVRVDVQLTAGRMRRVAERESLQPDLVRGMVDIAVRRAEQLLAHYTRSMGQAYPTAAFLHILVEGVMARREEIDTRVAGLSEGWALDRQPAVDRNILRVAAYEVLFLSDIPAGASINEAVELAKKFSTAESGRFVNGVLGALATAVGKDEKHGSERVEALQEEGAGD